MGVVISVSLRQCCCARILYPIEEKANDGESEGQRVCGAEKSVFRVMYTCFNTAALKWFMLRVDTQRLSLNYYVIISVVFYPFFPTFTLFNLRLCVNPCD